MSDISTKSAVELALAGNVNGFKDAVSQLMSDRVQDAIELKRHQVASNFMSSESEEELGIEGDTDENQEV